MGIGAHDSSRRLFLTPATSAKNLSTYWKYPSELPKSRC